MFIGNILFSIYSAISISIALTMACLFWRLRGSIGALPLSLLMLCEVEWALFYYLCIVSTDLQSKQLLGNFSFLAAIIMPVIWIMFVLQYTRQEKSIKRFYYFLTILPMVSIIILFSNNFHHLFIAQATADPMPNSTYSLLTFKFGIWFWIHSAYSYCLLSTGAVILMVRLFNSFKIYRQQAFLMISALIVSFSGDIIYQLGIGPFNNILITPLTFSLGGILLFISMFRYRALDLVPIAREAIIETMEDLVIVMDIRHRIVDLNKSARSLLSINHTALIGQSIESVLPNLPSLADLKTLSEKSHSEIMLEIDGTKIYYNAKVSPLLNKRKIAIGSFVILMDITDLYLTMEKLEKAKLLAESSNKAKSDFLATMSHEIRTPINGIIGMAELLQEADFTPQERENLETLQYSADSLLNIVNEILDFSKIEAGKMDIESVSFNIRALAENTAKVFNHSSKATLIPLKLHIEEAVPHWLSGDYVKLRQILSNLLSNAYKFTEKGEINIHVKLIQQKECEAVLAFSVSDTGIGIPEDRIQSLFESFQQLDSSTTRKYGGTGLGLAIVKRLVEMMDGSIEVESKIGSGSTFRFQLPFKMADAQSDSLTVSEASAAAESRSLKILVAEDSRINQMLIVQLLQKRNWTVEIAQTGTEALQKLQDDTYDLILMDIQMPEMDGYEASKRIRESEQATGRHIPIIALTANASPEDRDRCLASGMEDFLSKPIKSDKLYEYIEKYASF